jgi:hypothetical protein
MGQCAVSNDVEGLNRSECAVSNDNVEEADRLDEKDAAFGYYIHHTLTDRCHAVHPTKRIVRTSSGNRGRKRLARAFLTANQHTESDVPRNFSIKFGQVYLGRPNTKADGSILMFPNEIASAEAGIHRALLCRLKKEEVRRMMLWRRFRMVVSTQNGAGLVASIPRHAAIREYCLLKDRQVYYITVSRMDDMTAAGEEYPGSGQIFHQWIVTKVLIAQKRMKTNLCVCKHNATYTTFK